MAQTARLTQTERVKRAIQYGEKFIPFEVAYSGRKSLEISVHPGGAVVVRAPLGTADGEIEYRVHKHARWICRQILHFAQFDPRTPERRFVGGESHLYLGRKYRLKIRPADADVVSLQRGFFNIAAVDSAPEHIEALLEAWYRRRAEVYFARALEKCWQPFRNKGVNKPTLRIRSMKTRWGSLSGKGVMTLNLELIKAPGECVEYVIVHELCHLFHANHGANFYRLLEVHIPDWRKRKHKLETTLA